MASRGSRSDRLFPPIFFESSNPAAKMVQHEKREIGRVAEKQKITQQNRSRRFCVAPMMEWTDRAGVHLIHQKLTRRLFRRAVAKSVPL